MRVHIRWWGVHRTLNAAQKEEVGIGYGADARFLTAGKKIIDVRHEAFRKLTSLRTRIGNYWRGLTLPYVESGVRLIRQSDVETFSHVMEGFRDELTQAEADLNAVFDDIKADAQQRLGRLYNPADYPPEVRGLFGVEWDFPSIEPPSYLMRLSPDIYQQEQQRVAQRFEEAVPSGGGGIPRRVQQARLAPDRASQRHCRRGPQGVQGQRRRQPDRFLRPLPRPQRRQQRATGRPGRAGAAGHSWRWPAGPARQHSLRQHVAGAALASVQAELDGLLVDRPRRRIIRNTPETQS